MNKRDLVDAVAGEAGLSKSDAESALDAVVSAIVSEVARGERVTVPGFGTFEARDRAAREGRNPQTGASMTIAASRNPAFKAAAKFKSAVNDA